MRTRESQGTCAKRVQTTVAEPRSDGADLSGLHRSRPGTKYIGDITYLPLATGGNLYLATVIDCFRGG